VFGVGAVIVALAAATVVRAELDQGPRLGACHVISKVDIASASGVGVGTGEAFHPEGNERDASGCFYGRAPGVQVTVFVISPGGTRFLRSRQAAVEAHHVAEQNLSRTGYEAYKTAGPRQNSESVVVLWHDEYVEVQVFEARSGTADQFAVIAARHLA
jgi:hypothetical protein